MDTILDLQRPQFVPSEDEVREVGKQSFNFVPALKLIQATSPDNNMPATLATGEKVFNAPGAWYHSGTKVNYGLEVGVLICPGHRPHALEIINGKKTRESFNKDSPIYQDISITRNTKEVLISFGWEFLIFIPKTASFASLYFGRKSTRAQVPEEIFDYMREPEKRQSESKRELQHTSYFNLYSQFETQGQNRFWVPHISPLTLTENLLPPKELLNQVYTTFTSIVLSESKVTKSTNKEVSM